MFSPCAPHEGDQWEIVETNDQEWEVLAPELQDPTTTQSLSFWLNGEQRTVANPDPEMRLLEYLRSIAGQRSAKQGCNEGGCGCCTVAMSTGGGGFVQINSCLRLLVSVAGRHVWTSEGIGSDTAGYHAVQKALALGNGSQCGYCSPGWVMNMWTLLQQDKKWTPAELETQFDGNLCRCTGYRPILESFKKMVGGPQPSGPKACVNRTSTGESAMLRLPGESGSFAQPTSLDQLWQVVADAKGRGLKLRFVHANTSTGVTKYFGPASEFELSPDIVDLTALSDLEQINVLPDGSIQAGAGVSIARLIEVLGANTASQAQQALAKYLLRVAHVQVRSVGTWAGNMLMTRAHPGFGSDIVTMFAAAGVAIQIADSAATPTELSVEELMVLPDSGLENRVVLSMSIPPLKTSLIHTEKVAQRHVNSHAIVNSSICADLVNGVFSNTTIVFGGLAASGILRAHAAEAVIDGAAVSDSKQCFATALAALKTDLAKAGVSTDPRTTSAYRSLLADSFLYRFFLVAGANKLPTEYQSSIVGFAAAQDRPVSSGVQSFKTDPIEKGPIGQPVIKLSALKQASGEAVYTSDMAPAGTLHGAIVYTHVASKTITAIQTEEALAMPGVVDVVLATDLPKEQNLLPFQEILFQGVGDVSPCVGAAVGLVLARTEAQARAVVATNAVKVSYSENQPPIQAPAQPIKEAVKTLRDFGGFSRRKIHPAIQDELDRAVEAAEGDSSFKLVISSDHGVGELESTNTLTGSVSTGAQRHFYMETQSSVAVPQEGAIELHCSTQDAAYTVGAVATVLGIPQHKVTVKVRRAGGGFGGKLNRHAPVAAAASFAALKHGVPVAVQNERVADLEMTGGRESICADYTASFDSTGILNSIAMDMSMDCGWMVGECSGDVSMAIQFSDNCYYTAKYTAGCTPHTSPTAHGTSQRAPGVLQSQFIHECVMEHVARSLSIPHHEIQLRNFYQVGQKTPYNDTIGSTNFDWTIPQLWQQLTDTADLEARRTAVDAYNKANKWRKRGIATQPVKYGMGLPFYKSGALVNVYADGSVSVAHGGSEIGQGIHTVAAQMAASTLGVPLASVMVQDTDTSKIPHNTCTGGSGTTECTAEAVRQACTTLAAMVAKYKTTPTTTWEQAVTSAVAKGESLSASAWYENGAQDPGAQNNAYATYGVAATEVEIDVLTGEVQIHRTDILMDLGDALNPDLAIGQLEGGFIMAMGFLVTEEVLWSKDNVQLNLGSWNYKIPSAYDIPVEFNVSLLEGHRNTSKYAVAGSKANAEPAMPLAISAFFAIKEAIYAARADRGHTEWFNLNAPATVQAIATACLTQDADLDIPF